MKVNTSFINQLVERKNLAINHLRYIGFQILFILQNRKKYNDNSFLLWFSFELHITWISFKLIGFHFLNVCKINDSSIEYRDKLLILRKNVEKEHIYSWCLYCICLLKMSFKYFILYMFLLYWKAFIVNSHYCRILKVNDRQIRQ